MYVNGAEGVVLVVMTDDLLYLHCSSWEIPESLIYIYFFNYKISCSIFFIILIDDEHI